ncbi:MAG: hypothetical protein JOZ82_04210 [Marmoricola sp.]|nr:hypothetical protein [Marmoricola sp.]
MEGFTARVPAAGPTVGAAIRNASSPGDTIVSVLGDGVLVRTSGLESPYRYLWSLPAHVLDHHFQRLNALLDSPGRPSWVVVRGGKAGGELGRLGISAAVHAHYQPVAEICGRQVYLRDDLTRDVPRAPSPCWLPLVSWNPTHATHNWSVTEGAMR